MDGFTYPCQNLNQDLCRTLYHFIYIQNVLHAILVLAVAVLLMKLEIEMATVHGQQHSFCLREGISVRNSRDFEGRKMTLPDGTWAHKLRIHFEYTCNDEFFMVSFGQMVSYYH